MHLKEVFMTFQIEPEVTAYLKSKDQSFMTVKMIRKGSGWCAVPMPYVVLDEPKSSAKYDTYEQDGITIYISKAISLGEKPIHFRLKKFFFMKEIIVDGIQFM